MTAVLKFTPPISKPRLSDRTAAQFMRLPALDQMRILHDQKYPKQAPQVFRQPFYQVARHGIREILEHGAEGLHAARGQLQGIGHAPRRMHCMRVIETFWSSEHSKRGLRLGIQKRFRAELGGVELRLSPDLFAYEGDEERFIYFNFKAEQLDPEVARMTLEIAHWLLEQNGVEVKPQQLEFIDLFTGVLHPGKKRRARTIKLLTDNAKLIESMWPTIDP
ncbi:hypothetical protein AB4Y64_01545 [Lysobacter sp. TAF61]|uniref:hypothetical protein n=1 Tax=Lysobacter sp. TAF61 TaxID=3233072 RepID=UPI003F99F765